MHRDPTKLDPATKKPYCYGNEDPKAPVCLICRFSIVCRDVFQMQKGSAPVLPIASEDVTNDFVEEDDEDSEGQENE